MTPTPFHRRALATAAALALCSAAAQAQTTPAADANDTLSLDRVVVTGTSAARTKMKQSVSISTLEADQILKASPTNAAEILRSIPGVRSESSGGEGNANLTVRGVPISAGGARYVQFQEDGLPLLLFGDIAFGTADQFLRADYSLDRLEVVRGGSASTLASNSPGGLINFISKDGSEPGGAVGLTLGAAGGRQVRLDANYGAKLGQGTRFAVSGFQRVGEGDRPVGFNAAKGGQLKANLTHEFSAGNWVRVSLKALDDRTPSLMPVPTYVENGSIKAVNGIDPRRAFFIGSGFGADTVFNKDGGLSTTDPRDGLHVRSTAVGLEGNFKLDGWTVNNKFRVASNSGRFIAMFPANNGDGATPNTSSTFTGTLFNTSIDSLDNTVNDLKVSRGLGEVASGRATLTGGLFMMRQQVALTWFWNQYRVDMKNKGATSTLVTEGWDTWGGCCVRNFDVKYTSTAPYLALNWEAGPLSLDMSVRHDRQSASGYYREDNRATETWGTKNTVDYTVNHTSYSLGGNYQLNKDLALFARASDGVAFNADRILYGNPLDGSVPINTNQVRQLEGGVKLRSGPFSAFVTLFNARTTESNYEATTRTFTNNRYRANGVELEAAWRAGGFRVSGGATLTDAKITASNDASTVGNTPRRQARLVYQVAPSYSFGDFELGGALIGTGGSWGDDAHTIRMGGFTVANAYGSYQINDRLQASVSVNNLFNTIGYTEVEGDGHAARSINGRTVKLGLKYSF